MIDFVALDAAEGLPPTASNISRLATRLGADAASWAFNQWSLRKRAQKKFANAKSMLFTADGLEQASHAAVAAYHASRFPESAIVADLCCGIGGDLMAFSDRGSVTGFEIDPVTAAYAKHNAPQADIRVADCLAADWDFQYAFADPSRRPGGRRTLDVNSFLPNPLQLADRMRKLDLACMKLSPMLADSVLREISPSIEFVSFGWECREALAWFGEVEAGVTAVKVETGEKIEAGGYESSLESPLAFILEADPAAIRAHCLPGLCDRLHAHLLGDSNGYLTCDSDAESSWIRRYSVLESGSFDAKRVKSFLKGLGGSAAEIKSRAGIDIDEVRKRLTMSGKSDVTLLLYPVGKSVRFALVRCIKGQA
ncbi:MAG: class I SAM-dependent methyltransferase [Fimbriimonadales bacterium]